MTNAMKTICVVAVTVLAAYRRLSRMTHDLWLAEFAGESQCVA